MKNLVVIIFVVVLSGNLYAQGDLDNQFYIRIGYAPPYWSSYGVDSQGAWREGTKRRGGLLELGSIYMFNKLPLTNGLRLGVNVDWFAFEYHGFVYDEDVVVDVGILSKIGPSLSYSPVDKLVFDAYGKVVVGWIYAVGMVYDGQDMEDEDIYSRTGGLKYTFGVNVRYTKLILGFAFNGGALKLTNPNGDILGDSKGNSKTPLPSMSFTVGVSF